MRIALVLVGVVVAAGCLGDEPAAPTGIRSMAALGDSITLAANLDDARLGDNPGHSWATGAVPDDAVVSHHERLKEEVGNRTVNLARSGARMRDLAGQAERAVASGAEYVLILMGANDACARTVDGMTPVETFRRQFQQAARTLDEGLSEGAVVYVVSIPDVGELRALFWDVPEARTVWRVFGVCPALLGEGRSEAEVAAFRARLAAYNEVLREEAEAFGFAFDDGAVFGREIEPRDVSTLDYFHPSMRGQARLAEVTWEAGPLARPLAPVLE